MGLFRLLVRDLLPRALRSHKKQLKAKSAKAHEPLLTNCDKHLLIFAYRQCGRGLLISHRIVGASAAHALMALASRHLAPRGG